MAHERRLGRCEYCRGEVISVMAAKEHTIGDVLRSDLIDWSEGKSLRSA